ncbi:hypothetical protein RFI_28978, partial [Reticulomyxa filosa]
ITLLSFGSDRNGKNKHTLMMKYISVWNDNINDNYNKWIPFTDNKNNPIVIGRDENHYYFGVRAVIGGNNNNLLFITYYPYNISLFNLNTFQFIQHHILPTRNYICYHCFVLKSENVQEQEKNYEMILFCGNTGLLIEYNEYNNIFRFHQLHICYDIIPLRNYAYVCINNIILFFGGCGLNSILSVSKS